MEKSLEMLIEYILERCTGLETENRRLTQQLQKCEESKDMILDSYTRQSDKLTKLTKIIKPHIAWKEGKPYALHLYDNEGLLEVCDLLRIEEDGKAVL